MYFLECADDIFNIFFLQIINSLTNLRYNKSIRTAKKNPWNMMGIKTQQFTQCGIFTFKIRMIIRIFCYFYSYNYIIILSFINNTSSTSTNGSNQHYSFSAKFQ